MNNQLTFVDGKGLMIGKRIVCAFHPQLDAVKEIVEENGIITKEYSVSVRTLDGNITDTKIVKDLERINFFELFDIPSANLGKRAHMEIAQYLQMQMKKELCRSAKRVERMGFSEHGAASYVFDRNNVYSQETVEVQCSTAIPVMATGSFSEDEMVAYIERLLALMPGVSDVLFVMEIFSKLKPAFYSAGIAVDFAGAVIGRPGTYKTSLAKLVSVINDKQSLTFTDFTKKEVRNVVELFAGHTVLLDDFHRQPDYTDRQKQLKIADTFIREDRGGAFLLLTGEFIQGPESMQDRLIRVGVEELDPEEKRKFIQELSWLQKNKSCLWSFYRKFCEAVYSDLDNVKAEIVAAMESYPDGGVFRVQENVKKLAVSFGILNNVCFDGRLRRWDEQLTESISGVKKESVYHMMLLRKEAAGIDWLKETFDLLQDIEPNEFSEEVFFEKDKVFVDPSWLKKELCKRIYRSFQYRDKVPLTKIKKELDELGFLYRDSERDYTVKKRGQKRYYAIQYFALCRYFLE